MTYYLIATYSNDSKKCRNYYISAENKADAVYDISKHLDIDEYIINIIEL